MSIYDVKSKLDSEKDGNIADIIDDDDKDKLEEAIDEIQDWLADTSDAEKDDWQNKADEFDAATRSILRKYVKETESSGRMNDNDDFEFKDEL